MTPHKELATWAAACAFIACAWLVVDRPSEEAPIERQAAVARAPAGGNAGEVHAAARAIVAADPFRLDREPAEVAFVPSALRVAEVAPTIAKPPKPQLTLRAVVGGPPWQALLEGIPGRTTGSLVNAGDRIGDLIIVTINKDMIIVQGMDTTWRLGVTRPWQ